MAMEEEWLSISDVEKSTGIPERTIRRYIAHHGHHLHTKKQHRNYLLAVSALSVLTQIRDHYARGRSAEQVEAALTESGVPMTITVSPERAEEARGLDGELATLRQKLVDNLVGIGREQRLLREELGGLREEVLTKLEEQAQLVRELERERRRMMEFRDKELLVSMRKILETKRQPWWRKLGLKA